MATDTMLFSHLTPVLAITVGWFDLVFIATLGAGFWFGRHRGASNEYYPLLQWFAVCIAGAIFSGPLGGLMHKWLGLSEYTSQVFGYFVGGGMIFIVFVVMNVLKVNEILDGDFFGKGETHVGGVFGSLKFVMLLMIPLAVVQGRKFSEAQMASTTHGKV
ncbi:MAG: CvpA family protein [Limisphaerales bacterium]